MKAGTKYIAWMLVLVVLMVVGCGEKDATTKDPAMRKWAEYTAQVDKTKAKIAKAEKELMKLAQKWNEMYEEEGGISGETVILEEQEEMEPFDRLAFWTSMRLKNEQNIGVIPMLDEIISLNDEIVGLDKQISDFSESFDQPYQVKDGDTHFQLAMDYMVSVKGVPQEEAGDFILPAGLWDELEVGFLIYFYFDSKRLHTSVHQGEASISPMKFKKKLDQRRQAKFKLVSDSLQRVVLEKEGINDSLSGHIAELDIDIAFKAGLIDSLTKSNLEILKQKAKTQAERDSLDKIHNSISYAVVSQRELKKKGLYGGGFLFFGGAGLKPEAFRHYEFDSYIDTRDTRVIYTGQTSKVSIFSEQGTRLKAGEDYTFDKIDDQGKITINRIKPFTGHKILVMKK